MLRDASGITGGTGPQRCLVLHSAPLTLKLKSSLLRHHLAQGMSVISKACSTVTLTYITSPLPVSVGKQIQKFVHGASEIARQIRVNLEFES